MPTAEIGVVMDAQGDVGTFASPSETSTICLLSFFDGEATIYLPVELPSNVGDAGFDEEAGRLALIFASEAFRIEGVGDRAVGFEGRAFILVLAGESVVLINGASGEVSPDQAGEIGNLVAAALGQ